MGTSIESLSVYQKRADELRRKNIELAEKIDALIAKIFDRQEEIKKLLEKVKRVV